MKHKNDIIKSLILIFALCITSCMNKEKSLIEKLASDVELIIPEEYTVLENSTIKNQNEEIQNLKLHFDEKSYLTLINKVDSLSQINPFHWAKNKQIYQYFKTENDEKQNLLISTYDRTLIFHVEKPIKDK